MVHVLDIDLICFLTLDLSAPSKAVSDEVIPYFDHYIPGNVLDLFAMRLTPISISVLLDH
jgi:hypothetical protein